MAMYEYVCDDCGKTQTKWHKIDEENEEPCEKCGAPKKLLKKQLSRPSHHGHGTWGRWKV